MTNCCIDCLNLTWSRSLLFNGSPPSRSNWMMPNSIILPGNWITTHITTIAIFSKILKERSSIENSYFVTFIVLQVCIQNYANFKNSRGVLIQVCFIDFLPSSSLPRYFSSLYKYNVSQLVNEITSYLFSKLCWNMKR